MIIAQYQVPSFNISLLVFMTTAGPPWHNEGAPLPDQAEAGTCSQSYCLLHSTCHLTPRLGPNTLQAGVCVPAYIMKCNPVN